MENKEAVKMAGRERSTPTHLPLPPLSNASSQFSLLDAVVLSNSRTVSALRDWLSSEAQAIRLLEGGTEMIGGTHSARCPDQVCVREREAGWGGGDHSTRAVCSFVGLFILECVVLNRPYLSRFQHPHPKTKTFHPRITHFTK